MQHPHPWRELRAIVDIVVHWRQLPDGLRAVTDGLRRIWIARDLTQAERRSTLVHELVHIREGHHGCQPPKVERKVRFDAAMYLVPDIRHYTDALVFYDGDTEAAAEDLWVDEATVVARSDPRHMHPAEKAYLARRLADIDETSPA